MIIETMSVKVGEGVTAEFILDNAIACVCHEEYLDNDVLRWEIPHTDLVYYPRVFMGTEKSFKVTRGIVASLMMDDVTLRNRAVGNTLDKGFVVKSLSEIVGMPNEPGTPIVITSKDNMYGASGILFNSILKQAGEKLGAKEFYILPSSVHEVLVVKPEGNGVEEYQNMVRNINSSMVSADDKLSDSVYYFDGEVVRVIK